MNDDFELLLSSVCGNLANEEELAQLADLLREMPEARDEYLRYVDMHAALTDQAIPAVQSELIDYRRAIGDASCSMLQPQAPFRSIARSAAWLATGVVFLLAVGFAALQWRPRGVLHVEQRLELSITPIATLLFSQDCRWSGTELSEGQRLLPGRMQLESGTAVLRFEGGAELMLTGPTDIELQTPGRARVSFGDCVVRAEDGAAGFMLLTPTSEIIDLGTEFAVKVERNGATEVHVMEGEVTYSEPGSQGNSPLTVRAGEAIASSTAGGKPRAVPMKSPRFADFVNRINPRPRLDLLTAYDGFNYTAGELLLSKSTAGKGWSGPWRRRLPSEFSKPPGQELTSTELEIVHGMLNIPWPVPGGRLGMAKLPPGASVLVRELAQPIDMNQDRITFISWISRRLGTPVADTPFADELYLTLRSSESFGGESITWGHNGRMMPFIQSMDGVRFSSPVMLPPYQGMLWIGKIVSRPQGEDEIFLRIYMESESLDYAEPADWHVVSRGVQLTERFDRVILRVAGDSPCIMDELRIGPTWRSVAPMTE